MRISDWSSDVCSSDLIPGLIEGAADGAGLGSLFLRHVQRTRLLLHLVDIAPMETGVEAEPVEQVRAIEAELRKYDPAMLDKPRWLIINQADLMFEDEAREKAAENVAGLGWEQTGRAAEGGGGKR